MIVAITGHTNIEKATNNPLTAPHGIKYNKNAFDMVYNDIFSHLHDYCHNHSIRFSDLTLVSGMARGVDEVFAILAIRNDLPLILSIPNSIPWHSSRSLSRGMRAQAVYYEKILNYSNLLEVHEINKHYDNKKYPFANFARNQHMVDIADVVFSYKAYDSTGTDDCIKRALQKRNYRGNVL